MQNHNKPMSSAPAAALTIAGSDSCGGAGIQADIKTMTRWGVEAACVLTAITAQNTLGVGRALALDADLLAAQLDHVLLDVPVRAAKTGMLANASLIEVVARTFRQHRDIQLVIDPVMLATSGARLLESSAEQCLIDELLPLATLVTPNLPEAALLTGLPASAPAEDLAAALLARGCGAVLIKGGHAEGPELTDTLVMPGFVRQFRHPRRSGQIHGTGCSLSAGITAALARGMELELAVERALGALHAWLPTAYPAQAGPLLMLPFASGADPLA